MGGGKKRVLGGGGFEGEGLKESWKKGVFVTFLKVGGGGTSLNGNFWID